MKKFLLLFLVFLGIDIVVFWNLWNTSFQQDEWIFFGEGIYFLGNLPGSILNLLTGNYLGEPNFHYFPLNHFFQHFLFLLFGLNAGYYAWMSLILNSIIGILLFTFIKNITKNSFVSFCLTSLFIVSYPARQTVVWFAVTYSLGPTVICVLVFFVLLDKFKKKINIRHIFFLALTFLAGILFKEDAFIIIPIMPLYTFLYWNKKERENGKKSLIYLYYFMGGVISLRFIYFIIYTLQASQVNSTQGKALAIIAYNILTTPFKMVVQNLIEFGDLITLSGIYTKVGLPFLVGNGLAIQTSVMQNVIYLIAIVILILGSIAFAKSDKKNRNLFMFSLAWIIICSTIIALQPNIIFGLEPRYLFLGNVGVLLLGYTIFNGLVSSGEKKKKLIKGIFATLFIFVVVYFYLGNRYLMTTVYIPLGQKRLHITQQMKTLYPAIFKKTVFYIECKDPKECQPDGNVLPFQENPGWIMLVLYSMEDKKVYARFFKDNYIQLRNPTDQGYKELNGYGFGFFREWDSFEKFMSQKKNPPEIIAFSYDRVNNRVEDISQVIKNRLKTSK